MKKIEQEIRRYLQERGWDELAPANLAKSIMIEGAELLELFQWEEASLADVKKDKAKMAEIKKELADVFIYALDLSVTLGLDTEKIILEKLALVKKKYPAAPMRARARAKSGSGTDAAYLRIKKMHRKK